MLIIYGSGLSSPANKVRFVANYLGLEYQYQKIDLAAGEHRKPEYLAINPFGKVPAISDDGFCLSESGAIIRYLADKKGSAIYPRELKERAIVDQWMDFVTIHVGGAAQKIAFNRIFAPRMKIPVDERALQEGIEFLKRFLSIVEAQLQRSPFLCGENITLADFTLLANLDPSEMAGIDLAPYPALAAWRTRLKSEKFYTSCHKEFGETLKGPGGR